MREVVVIGGGAAGMMAALYALRGGASVTLLERNEKLGKKIYITGKMLPREVVETPIITVEEDN